MKSPASQTTLRLAAMIGVIITLLPATFGFAADGREAGDLDKESLVNLVRRSYQYVVMYHFNSRLALDPSFPSYSGGYNRFTVTSGLFDHTTKGIVRPNNDMLSLTAMLDLGQDAVILELPALASPYALVMATGYDYYVTTPMATTKGDFKHPENVLFYTARTEGFKGGKVEGIDRSFEMTCDFVAVVLQVMPSASDRQRFAQVREQLGTIKLKTLGQFQGRSALPPTDPANRMEGVSRTPGMAQERPAFPAFDKSATDIFAANLLDVMQFVMNHTTFDPKNAMDHELLAAYRPLGVEPGRKWDPTKAARIDGRLLQKTAINIAASARQSLTVKGSEMVGRFFRPKGGLDLESAVMQAVLGPVGQPIEEVAAMEPKPSEGLPFNAQRDWVVRMGKAELPPARAFWSLTLYDRDTGAFIANDLKKYAVGENSGMRLGPDGGIEIIISAEKPLDFPDENWLPINRGDADLALQFRLYTPDVEALRGWKPPRIELLP